MAATGINHVSIHADDLEQSARFYEQLFDLERIPSPNFEQPVIWLRLGDRQLHLFKSETPPPRYHHIGLDVDDFEAVYLRARELGLLDPVTFGGDVRVHPAGWVQMYLRDPAGNLVEVDWPDASTLDRSIVTEITKLEDKLPQKGAARRATLYLERRVTG